MQLIFIHNFFLLFASPSKSLQAIDSGAFEGHTKPVT